MKKLFMFTLLFLGAAYSMSLNAQTSKKILKVEKDSDKLNITIKDQEHFNNLKNFTDDYIEDKYKNVDGIKDIKLKRNTTDEIIIKIDKNKSKFLLENYFNIDPIEISTNKDL